MRPANYKAPKEKDGAGASVEVLIGSIEMYGETLLQFEQEAEIACESSEDKARVSSNEVEARESSVECKSEHNGTGTSSIAQQRVSPT